MSIVTDPDDLTRFSIIFSGTDQTVSIRGLGTNRTPVEQTGDSAGTTTFTDTVAGDFVTDSVTAGDVLCIISDPAEDGGIMGHYRVVGSITATTFVVDRSIPNSTAADLTYQVYQKQTTGGATAAVADGVTLQALYSFAKEEWITLGAGLGNAQDLNKFDFPWLSITTEEFIMGGVNGDASSAWAFASDNAVESTDDEGVPRELVRTAGWQERDASDNILKRILGTITLGDLDSDAQVYYQQHADDIAPADIKLTGAVNQGINIFDEVTGPDGGTGFAITTSNTITRNDGGNWFTDGYRAGGRITIRAAEDVGNNGTFVILTVANSVDGAIVVTGTPLTNNAADTTMIAAVDKRFYLKLFCRKKTKSYASATELNAGVDVSAGGVLRAKVEKFPLSHADDPAILLDDGQMAGDATTVGDIFREVETHATDTTGVTTDLLDGTFSFDAAAVTPAFNDGILQPGDSLQIASGSYQGFYEIKEITDADTIVCYHEPTATYPGNESTLTFTTRTNTRDSGLTNATLSDVGGGLGDLTSVGATFTTDGGLGDRIVAIGDIVEVYAGTGAVLGYYKVDSIQSATVLRLDTSDQVFSGETSQSYRVHRPGMFLQRFESTATIASATNINFADANPDTLTRTGGSWVTDGFLDGGTLTVVNAEDTTGGPTGTGNLQTFIINTVTAATITLIAEEAVVANALDTTASTDGNITGINGVVRTVNQVSYPFRWRLFANQGDLSQVFQFIQKQLRRPTDIDGGSGLERGDITDLLMTFASPNGVTLDMFPDDLAAGDSNNVTYQDTSGDSRNNAFLVGITFVPNADLIASANARITVYFTNANGNLFGTNNAIIVQDETPANMDFTTVSGNIQRSFDYTNNAQGGRTPDSDAGITIMVLGDNLAQQILITDTITKVNSKTISLSPPTERNYAT